jgi:hypothetical protein
MSTTRSSLHHATVHRAPRFAAVACLLAPLLVSTNGRAQALTAGVEKPPPNVLLLVDTSGSMELKADNTAPACNALSPTLTNQKNRWIDLVEVLTGTFANYSCWAQDRGSAGFKSEFSLSGNAPYDYNYTMPYTPALLGGAIPTGATDGAFTDDRRVDASTVLAG